MFYLHLKVKLFKKFVSRAWMLIQLPLSAVFLSLLSIAICLIIPVRSIIGMKANRSISYIRPAEADEFCRENTVLS